MAMRAPTVPRTADDLDALPADGNRYEIIDGELFVSAAPSMAHQRMLVRLVMRLFPYAEPLGIEVLVAPVDVRASAVTQVEPDLLALPRRHADRGRTRWEPMSLLLLAVEILSPSTAAVDRGKKRQLYTSAGVDQYWIVDLEAGTVEVWRPGAILPHVHAVGDALLWQPVVGVKALEINVATLFEEVQ
jgi:Uma2 family endonuclease